MRDSRLARTSDGLRTFQQMHRCLMQRTSRTSASSEIDSCLTFAVFRFLKCVAVSGAMSALPIEGILRKPPS